MLNIVLFGPPGCGKGTQAEKLVNQFNLYHISTGDLFRSEIKNETPLGLEAKSFMDRGALVPDTVTIDMLKAKMVATPEAKGFIFDGFPRTIPQAEALDKMLAEIDAPVRMMLSLKVNDEELTKRLLLRGLESGRPDDQNESIIRNRVQVYNEQTKPVADFYAKQNKLSEINGENSIEEVFQTLCMKMNDL